MTQVRPKKGALQIFFYASHPDKNCDAMGQSLKTYLPEMHVERYTTIACLAKRLLQNLETRTIAVVQAASEQDLIDLYFIQHLLRKVGLVLLLPDTERDTIAMGHRLHPSYMCNGNNNLSEITEALRSIVVNGTSPQPIGQFRNPFESIMPNSFRFFDDDRCVHAAA